MRARAAFSLLAGLIFSLLLAASFSLRGAGPPSAPTSGSSFRFDFGTKYEPGQFLTADQSGWGWTRRARAVVAAGGYGVGANSITLSIDPSDPPIPPFPIALPPHGDIDGLNSLARFGH